MSTRRTKAAATGREQAAAHHRAEVARAQSLRTRLVSAGVAVVLVVLIGLGALYQSSRSGPSGTAAAPGGVTDGGVTVGRTTAPVTVTVYEDFQCPACRTFEQRAAATLTELREAGRIQVLYKPIAFLDRASTDDYSSRSLNAAACLLQESPAGFAGLHSALMDQQPAEGGPGLSDQRLTEMVSTAGAPEAASCIRDRTFDGWTKAVTEQASKDGVNQTPTVLVQGQALPDLTPEALRAAVAAA